MKNIFKLIRDSFRFKRKTLKNNLKGYNLKIIEDVLIKAIILNSRAEEIPLEILLK